MLGVVCSTPICGMAFSELRVDKWTVLELLGCRQMINGSYLKLSNANNLLGGLIFATEAWPIFRKDVPHLKWKNSLVGAGIEVFRKLLLMFLFFNIF